MKNLPAILCTILLPLGLTAQSSTSARLAPSGPVLKVSASGFIPPIATARIGLELPQSDRTSVEISGGLVLHDYTGEENLSPSPEFRISWYKYNNLSKRKNPSRAGIMYAFRTITYSESHTPWIDTAQHWSSTEPSYDQIQDNYRVWQFHQQLFFYTGKKFARGDFQFDLDLGLGFQMISTKFVGHTPNERPPEVWLDLGDFPPYVDEEGVSGQFAVFLEMKFGKVMKPFQPPGNP